MVVAAMHGNIFLNDHFGLLPSARAGTAIQETVGIAVMAMRSLSRTFEVNAIRF